MKLRITLIKEITTEAEGRTLWEQLKKLLAPAEPMTKDVRIIDNHELE